MVAWNGTLQDGSAYGVVARQFSAQGVADRDEFLVDSFTPGQQTLPPVAAGAGGDFVVAWQSKEQDGSGYGVFTRARASAFAPKAVSIRSVLSLRP